MGIKISEVIILRPSSGSLIIPLFSFRCGVNLSSPVSTIRMKEVKLKEGVLIEAFTGVGMAASIAANYLISALHLDQVAAMDSDDFPPVSMIYNARPKLPLRVYCSTDLNVAVFTSEIPLPAGMHRTVAAELMKWAEDAGCTTFISLDAIPVDEEEGMDQARVWAITTSERSRQMAEAASLDPLQMGIITGVSAIMLNQGKLRNLDVIGLFAEARINIPDAAAAAALMQSLNKLIKPFNLSVKPLVDEARQIQSQLENLRKQAEPAIKDPYSIYS